MRATNQVTGPRVPPGVLLLLAAMLLAVMAAVPSVFAQSITTGISTGEETLEGRVVEVFGARFILETPRGRVLVDPISPDPKPTIGMGDRVLATGRISDNTLLSRRIARPDGTLIHEPSLVPLVPPMEAATGAPDIQSVLAALQLTPTGAPVRKKHHTEVTARMADGRTVFVSFDRLGRIAEIEDAVHVNKRALATRPLAPSDYIEIVRRAGFTPLENMEIETKKHHVEVLARNRAGEVIALHIDRAGYIYKQVWIR